MSRGKMRTICKLQDNLSSLEFLVALPSMSDKNFPFHQRVSDFESKPLNESRVVKTLLKCLKCCSAQIVRIASLNLSPQPEAPATF